MSSYCECLASSIVHFFHKLSALFFLRSLSIHCRDFLSPFYCICQDELERQRESAERSRRDQQQRLAREAQHQRSCVFNALTSTNGYESDSSYIIKKRESKKGLFATTTICQQHHINTPSRHTEQPEPATRETYVSVQRGDSDIPLAGLQKPAPHPRAHKGTTHLHCTCQHLCHPRCGTRGCTSLVRLESVALWDCLKPIKNRM